MCTNCDELNIPIGPTGATGATGPQGPAGTNGINGTNGTTILSSYNNLIGVGTPADLTEKILFTHTLNANELSTDGDELELFAYYEYFNNKPITLRIKLGSKIVTLNIVDTVDDIRILKIKISRISQTSQFWTIEEIKKDGLGVMSINTISIDSSTVDLATILAFEITGQNSFAGADKLILKKATLYKYSV